MSLNGTFNSFICTGLTVQRTMPKGPLDQQFQALDTALQCIGFQPLIEGEHRAA